MTDLKYEAVAWRTFDHDDKGWFLFHTEKDAMEVWPGQNIHEPLYSASTIESLTAEVLRVRKSEAETIRENIKIVAEIRVHLDALKDNIRHLSSEARRYAGFYPEASDGRNTFIIFAEMIEGHAAFPTKEKPHE